MATTDDRTTLVCLFHGQGQANAVVQDLLRAGIPQSFVSLIDGTGSRQEQFSGASLAELGVPERDQKHLLTGLNDGGTIVAVSALQDHFRQVEAIFRDHRAEKIDEAEIDSSTTVAPSHATVAPSHAIAAGEAAIPVIEEELVVGKRTVDQGGVRLYRRLIEIPVAESVNLREEHVSVVRNPVDRAVTNEDLALQGDRTIELTETAEEAVVSKNARVVEEIRLGKDTTERTERIHDTVRKTEVVVEEVDPQSMRDR